MIKKALPLILLTTTAFASGGSEASAASTDLSAQGISQVVDGSANLFAAASQLVIVAVKTVGDVTYISLKAAGQSAVTTIQVSSHVAGHSLLAAGQWVRVVTTGTGIILTSAGRLIAYVPNELGKSFLFSSQI
ncbi:hypothetical protein DIZ81_06715 [Legionella taurinensis]|uniref:Uncharacterized protein n=2 Tax=Legionella taurinensis TaxID=70611 RepID=A0A3A5L4M7_9GAMM|nr:hypothetical protein [Legionella taurinensis]PUT40290.1 hypothetical protein DB744_06715 [Legionella taurinensis]PUT41524.1 hypothetical protein DB746_09225 [Legionella taurinensis]PUT44390.1 hypothetical protein DB743_08440 [Legionella taurinensis]PUT48352.1 hypothetical protein DB745_05115 [Legionella taurinensis]RJT44224.1 hypothetical protein D6J04_12785 [Legionella taurinensis]